MKISLSILLGLTMAFVVQTGEGGKPKPVSCVKQAEFKWKWQFYKCRCDDGEAFAKPDCGSHIKECYPHKC